VGRVTERAALGHGFIAIVLFVKQVHVKSGAFRMLGQSREAAMGKNLGVMTTANKGGVGLAFALSDATFAVCGCHLSSDSGADGKSKLAKRNEQAREMMQALNLNNQSADLGIDFPCMFHHVIIAGDLNYRLNQEFPIHTTLQEIAKACTHHGDWRPLASQDELLAELRNRHVLYNFEEPALGFAPTYRRRRLPTSEENFCDVAQVILACACSTAGCAYSTAACACSTADRRELLRRRRAAQRDGLHRGGERRRREGAVQDAQAGLVRH